MSGSNKKANINLFILTLLLLSFTVEGRAFSFHCEEDSIAALHLLATAESAGDNYGKRIVAVAGAMEGIKGKTLPDVDTTISLTVNLHEINPLQFVNNAMAFAFVAGKQNATLSDYGKKLEDLSRKKGVDNGFPSHLFYGAEWIGDNIYRGNLQEMTEYLTGGGFRTKTLDYLSRHRNEISVMKDSVVNENIRMNEMGYRGHRIPHLKKQSIGNKSMQELLQEGDIIMMLSPAEDYDVYDIGIVGFKNGEPFLIHIDRTTGQVVSDPYPLSRLFKVEGQHFYGYRWLRPNE